MRLLYALLLSLLAFSCSPVMAAQVIYDPLSKSLVVSGPTNMQQVIAVNEAFNERVVDVVYLKGPGGDFYAGLRLGQILRRHNAHVVVPSEETCISACAFAFLGGTSMSVKGTLLLHSPYLPAVNSNATLHDIGKAISIGAIDMAEYLLEMGYPITLASLVTRHTSPCMFIAIRGDGSYSWLKGPDIYSRDDSHFYLQPEDRCQP